MGQQLSDYDYQEMRDIWDDFNHRQEFEHDLINRKTTWLLATQGLFFTAYGVSLRDLETTLRFHRAVALAGLLIALITFLGVAFVVRSKRISWRDYRCFYEKRESLKPPKPFHKPGDAPPVVEWGVRTRNTWWTLAPDLLIPALFIAIWAYLLL